MSIKKLTKVQHGLETVPGTLVPATFMYPGQAELEFDDNIQTPDYDTGEHGYTVEDTFPTTTGSILRLKETDASPELLTYMFNMAIKQVLSDLVTPFQFPFTFPTTGGANTISTFTFEMADNVQEYKFGYGFLESFTLAGDAAADNGRVKFSGVVRGRKATPSTLTAALGYPANHTAGILNLNYASIKVAALGTAPSGGTAWTGRVRGMSFDVKSGWTPGMYADGRSTQDFSVAEYGNYEITGRLKCLFDATSVTELASFARAGVGRNIEITLTGAGGVRKVTITMPIVYTAVPVLGATIENNLVFMEFPFKAGYSRTAVALGASIQTELTAGLTVT